MTSLGATLDVPCLDGWDSRLRWSGSGWVSLERIKILNRGISQALAQLRRHRSGYYELHAITDDPLKEPGWWHSRLEVDTSLEESDLDWINTTRCKTFGDAMAEYRRLDAKYAIKRFKVEHVVFDTRGR